MSDATVSESVRQSGVRHSELSEVSRLDTHSLPHSLTHSLTAAQRIRSLTHSLRQLTVTASSLTQPAHSLSLTHCHCHCQLTHSASSLSLSLSLTHCHSLTHCLSDREHPPHDRTTTRMKYVSITTVFTVLHDSHRVVNVQSRMWIV